MHPSARLALWLLAVLTAQALRLPALLLLAAGALLAAPGAAGLWLSYCRRARWLLLTLWLVLAWHAPGEAWFEQAWLPTREGVALASEQAVRLLTVLACLAGVYAAGGREGMLAGLWGLLAPWRRPGGAGERLVVRLALCLNRRSKPTRPVSGRNGWPPVVRFRWRRRRCCAWKCRAGAGAIAAAWFWLRWLWAAC